MSKADRPIVDFSNCVVAIIGAEFAGKAVEAVQATGHEVMHLSGPGDADKLAAHHGGVLGALSKMVAAYGDELRIMEDIERALFSGDNALIVQVEREDSAALSELLKEHGAASIWDFRGWTFTKTGEADGGTEA